jgi:outer membrane murein-binding lipoprotein Lpp
MPAVATDILKALPLTAHRLPNQPTEWRHTKISACTSFVQSRDNLSPCSTGTTSDVSELSRDIQALAVDVATLRNEMDYFRAELRAITEWVLEGNQLYAMRAARSAEGTGPLPGCSHAPDPKKIPAETVRSMVRRTHQINR